jgi:hypothetical protein
LYNIGEQILLFRLEYDKRIIGVYVSFLVPRQVVDRAEAYPLQVKAEEAGLRVESELRHTNRRIPAFADDANGAFRRDAENLARIKKVLEDFGLISGLETNVDKTTLMSIGNLDEPISQEVKDLGFEIVTEIKCLGLKINNRADNLSAHFDGTISKIRQLIGLWSRYNLSLGGKIAIAKTMLISQIGYIGCIIQPTTEQLNTLQTLIDSYVTNGTVIAADRLYTKPKAGGIGLIRLSTYLTALQCSWVKRCSITINDSLRWTMAVSCDFCFDNLRTDSVDSNLHPVIGTIIDSFCKLKVYFLNKHDNYLQALLVDNRMFLRAEPGRRAPVRGVVDRNLLGADFYDNNKERLRTLRMNCLIRGGRVVDYNSLCRNSALNFPPAAYLNLVTAANFAIKKYGNKQDSNGTSLPTSWIFTKVKKGSKKFRLQLENKSDACDTVVGLRVVATFFELIECPVPDKYGISLVYSSWSWHFLSNRIRTFCFQFYNNSLGTNTRIAARYRNRNVALSDRCIFCVKSGSANPMRETFIHIFYDCPQIASVRNRVFSTYFPPIANDHEKRLCYMTGIARNAGDDRYIFVLTSVFINYTMWQFKLRKTVPSYASIVNDVDNLFESAASVSDLVQNIANTNALPICRRWTANRHGRG